MAPAGRGRGSARATSQATGTRTICPPFSSCSSATSEPAASRQPWSALARLGAHRPRLPRANGLRRARRHIGYHYDLGNDLFQLFLDESLTYSCAYFERPGQSLAEAQQAKYRRLCEKLAIGPDDHVLEIGCGWGGFALHARESAARASPD